MANKRPPLSFPEFEPKGRGAILRSAEEVMAEEKLLESQSSGSLENQQTSIPESQNAGLQESQLDSPLSLQSPTNRALYQKVTYRLSPDTVEAIDEIKRILRRQHKIKVSLEEIAEEAILAAYKDLLENKLSSFLVNKLSRTQ